MMGFLRGTATALVTPFSEDGVNLSVLEQLIDRQISAGVSAIVVLGSTGEPAAMSESEKKQVIRRAVGRANGRIKVIVGTGSNNVENAINESLEAQNLGADGLLCITPYCNKCTQAGLIEYYRALSQAIEIPIICYNVPSRTGVNILPATMRKIAAFPNIAGIKEASGNMAQIMETARAVRNKCELYSGDDMLNLPILAAGGSAVISVLSNLVPEEVDSTVQAALSGDFIGANQLNDRLLPLLKACFSEANPIPVKEGLNLLGLSAGIPRPPLTPLKKTNQLKMMRALARFGVKR